MYGKGKPTGKRQNGPYTHSVLNQGLHTMDDSFEVAQNALQGTEPSAAQSMISASRDGCVTPVLHDALLRLFEINTDNTTMQRAKPTTLKPIPFHRWFAKILDAKDLQGWKDILGKTATGTDVMDSDDCIDIGDCSDIRAIYTLVITRLHFRTLASKALACET